MSIGSRPKLNTAMANSLSWPVARRHALKSDGSSRHASENGPQESVVASLTLKQMPEAGYRAEGSWQPRAGMRNQDQHDEGNDHKCGDEQRRPDPAQ